MFGIIITHVRTGPKMGNFVFANKCYKQFSTTVYSLQSIGQKMKNSLCLKLVKAKNHVIRLSFLKNNRHVGDIP